MGKHKLFSSETCLINIDGICLDFIVFPYIYQKITPGLGTHSTFSNPLVLWAKRAGFEWLIKAGLGLLQSTWKNKDITKADILILADVRNKSLVQIMRPVIHALKEDNKSYTVVYSDASLSKCYPGSRLNDFYAAFKFKDYLRATSSLIMFLYNLNKNRKKIIKNLINDYSLSRGDAKALYRYIKYFGMAANLNSIAADRLLECMRPDKILLSTDVHMISRILALKAKEKNIPSLVIQHGATISPYGYVPVSADYMAVWGEVSRKWFIHNGVNNDKLVITGNPKYDDHLRRIHTPFGTINKIVILTNPVDWSINKRLIDISVLAGKTLNTKIVLKPHPSEPVDVYFEYSRQLGGFEVSTEGALDEIVQAGDCVMITCSSAGIESLLLGANLFVLNERGLSQVVPYVEYGAAELFDDEQELIGKIMDRSVPNQLLSENITHFLTDYIGAPGSSASKKIIDILDKVI